MSESDTTLRSPPGGLAFPSPAGSEHVVTSLPAPDAGVTHATKWFSLRRLATFPVLMGILLGGVSLIGARLGMLDPDTWWHIAVGQRIIDTHVWPTADSYSFTAPGTHWIAYEWLGEMAMAYAAHLGGFLGLANLQILLVAIVIVLLYYYAYVRCGSWKAACVATGLFLPIASVIFTLRPQLFGYIFLLVTFICLEKFRQGHSRALWILPPLMLVWINTHGTFAFGMVAIAAYFAGGLFKFEVVGLIAEPWTKRQRVQLLSTIFFCCVATLITPYGTEVAAYPLIMATSQPFNIANIQEWQPLAFNLAIGKYFLALVLVLFLAHILFPIKYRLQEMAILLFAVYSACVHIRFMLVFVMVIVPVVAMFLVRWMPRYDPAKEKYGLNLAMIAIMLIGIAKYLPSRQEVAKVVAKDYPVAAVEYLRQHPHPTGMFNDYSYGGYLIWQLGPQHKVFIDGRADMYEYSGVFQDYAKIANLENNALALLEKYGVQSCLIKSKSGLSTLLAAASGWKQIYSDDTSVFFVRSGAPEAAGD